MIDVTISYNLNEEELEFLENPSTDIQLSLYQYDLYKRKEKEILKCIDGNTRIKVVHLPLQTLKIPFVEIYTLISDIFNRTGCNHYVLHPNEGIDFFLRHIEDSEPFICVETFAWKRNKKLRSPLEIVEACQTYTNTWMTIDTCHIEDLWFDHRIMPYLLKYTKVIHLSNRSKALGQHIPFNHPDGELPLVKFVRELKYKYNWQGIIVLEYMGEYFDKLIKNHNYVKRLLEDKK